jgi:hypothetical protein
VLVAGETLSLATAAGAVSPDTWAQLRMCESSGRYSVNTGNGYYGAYQFDLRTWHGLGYPGLPSDASPAVQDEAAQKLYQQRGWQPWPACSAKLGLVDDRAASRDSTRAPLPSPSPVATPAPTVPAAIQPPAAAPVPTAQVGAPTATSVPTPKAGPWDGHYMTIRDVGTVRQDVVAWQTRMNAAGYHLAIDGRYGPQSAGATTQFEVDHHLSVERPGVVGPQVWGALFGQ